MNLDDIAKTIVENLQYSLIFKITQEIANEDIFVARQELDRMSDSELMSEPEVLYKEAKVHFINRAIDNKAITQKLVEIPDSMNLKLRFDKLGIMGEDIIELAKASSLITLLMYLIPRAVVGATILPRELRQQGVNEIVKQLLHSEESRKMVISAIEKETRNRKITTLNYENSSILEGYDIKPEDIERYTASTIALIIISSTELPYTQDEVLELPLKTLIRETTSYILTMHALNALKNAIVGTGGKKPFDWPITGDKKSCTQVLNLLDILRDISLSLRTCPIFAIELMSQKMKMGYEDYIVFFLNELLQYYEDTLRRKRGRGKNEKLKQFIEFVREEKRTIAKRILESSDKGAALAKELRDCKLKAKSDFRPDISPEERYMENLRSLDKILKIRLRNERFSSELIDELRPVFDSIGEVVKKNESDLKEDVYKFTDALCFQTCFQILEYIQLGENLIDLPWISRFIAEEAVRSSISSGKLEVLGEEYRTKRIIAAYLGGLSYLILQSHVGRATFY